MRTKFDDVIDEAARRHAETPRPVMFEGTCPHCDQSVVVKVSPETLMANGLMRRVQETAPRPTEEEET